MISAWGKEIVHDSTSTTAGVKEVIDLRLTGKLIDEFTVEVDFLTAPPTACAINVEGSLDGTDWTVLQSISQAQGSTCFFSTGKLVRMVRVNIASVTIGTCTGMHITAVFS